MSTFVFESLFAEDLFLYSHPGFICFISFYVNFLCCHKKKFYMDIKRIKDIPSSSALRSVRLVPYPS